MRRPAALFPIVIALGAMILAPRTSAQAQDAQEGPTEIEKCQAISKPGSYKLVRNLTATGNADCLVITATGFITIDLAGFSISGGGLVTTGTGILAAPSSGSATVRNGSISSFQNGVDLSSAGGSSIVEGLRVVGLSDGRGESGTGINANGIVRGNTASGHTLGISATGIVTGNSVDGNFTIGISVGAGSTVIGNTANFNGIGIEASCPSNVTDNTAITDPFGNIVLRGDGCNNTNNVVGP